MLKKIYSYPSAFILALTLLACGGQSDTINNKLTEDDPTVSKHKTCITPTDITLSDIPSLVKWINALPKPTTLPCFVESLPRPLYINMTTSTFSAQPSTSSDDPRIFIFYGDLTISVVTDHDPNNITEDGKRFDLLEISTLTRPLSEIPEDEDIMSIKGELVFPIVEKILPEAPHERVVLEFTESTSGCGLCHSRAGKLDYTVGTSKTPVFQSIALRPFSTQTYSLTDLQEQYKACESKTESFRCLMMSALFDYGEVAEKNFPDRMLEFGSPSWRVGA